MDTTPLSNTSSDFIAFSDSDSSPNVNKTPKVYNNYNNKRISGYNNNNRNFNNRWSPKYTSPDNQQNQHWYRNNNRNKFYKKMQQHQQQGNKNRYLHWSFMEDPWANLIKQIDNRKQEDDGSNHKSA